MLRLRSSALAAALAFLLLPLCPAWGRQRMLGGMLGRDSTAQYLSPLSPLHLPQLNSPLASPASLREAKLCSVMVLHTPSQTKTVDHLSLRL